MDVSSTGQATPATFPEPGRRAPNPGTKPLQRPSTVNGLGSFSRLLQSSVALASLDPRGSGSALGSGALGGDYLTGMSLLLALLGRGRGSLPGLLAPSLPDAQRGTSVPRADQTPAPQKPPGSQRDSGGGDVPYQDVIEQAARRYGIPPALIAAVARAESGFNPEAHSPAGAIGIMQLMPGTAAGLGVADPWDPAQNIHGGAQYLRNALNRYGGDLSKAIQAYNAGAGAVDKFGGDVPYAETRRYLPRVMSLYEHYQQAWQQNGGKP